MITLNDVSFNHNDTFSNYIYINPNSLSLDLCNEIIDMFNKSDIHEGCTAGGVNKKVKDTRDFQTFGDEWINVNALLMNEIEYNVNQYAKLFECDDYKSENNHTDLKDFRVLEPTDIRFMSQFMVQKYDKNKGRYIYHNDFSVEDSSFRILTYLWYLNDVTEGGETVFSGKYQIKPKSGTLAIFPSSWTFPHCGKMPVSNDKYIITGWMYSNYNKKSTKK
jgi:hypothetical protein